MPSVEQHLHKLSVILGGGVEAAIAAEWGRRHCRDGSGRLLLQQAVYADVLRGHARLFGERHGVGRIHHSERYEDALLEMVLKRRAGDFLDDFAEHQCAGAVVPFVAGIVHEWQLPLFLFRRFLEPVDDRIRKRVGDARGMGQEMSDCHLPFRRSCFVSGVGFVELRNDLQVVEAGQVFRYWIVELELALFEQHHDGHRSYRLGHGRNRKNGIHGHRSIVSYAELAGCGFVEHVVEADDECDDARRVAAADSSAQLAR
jgi:hypothetical protein